MSAVSRLLAVYELVHAICKKVQLQKGNGALLPLSRVSRSVGSIALDLLWERQESLAPLFKVLPCVIRQTEERIGCEGTEDNPDGITSDRYQILTMKPNADMTVSIPAEQWVRLQMYARRIKVLDDKPLGRYEDYFVAVKSFVLAAARPHCDDGVLLPNVHTLLLGPRMKTLLDNMTTRVRLTPAKDGAQTAYVSVMKQASSLVINLCRLDALQGLAITPDNRLKMLPALRAHAGLRELHFPKAGVADEGTIRDDDAAPTPGFHGLKTLRISEPFDLRCATNILENLSTEPLELREVSVTGQTPNSDEADEAADLYSAIRDACNATTLTHLTIMTHLWGGDQGMVAREYFADLLAFPNITHAEIRFSCENADVDGALDAMTKAWPKLEVLKFVNRVNTGWDDYKPKYKKSSLGSLACLAQRCPQLSLLALELDTSAIPTPIVPTETLERRITLDVGDNKIRGDTNSIGLFLASVFPWPTLVVKHTCGENCAYPSCNVHKSVQAINLKMESTKPLTTKQVHRRAKRMPLSEEDRIKLAGRTQAAAAKAPEPVSRTLDSLDEIFEPITNTPEVTAAAPMVADEPSKLRTSKRKRGADAVPQEDARPAKTRRAVKESEAPAKTSKAPAKTSKAPPKTSKASAKTRKATEASKPPARARKARKEGKLATEPTRRSERLRDKAAKA
ncbi:hypothetical protein BD626DRAFT_583094 [Schizophyllum amplum]|uniref:Uncharacterized protein n=1 Tax=Schizophyllum amplum TaxID=97359 RepID=A0A550CIN1_9AGAR|nr:hypothetical protein BD626DRAFT_583094 [Auriculariopsis ampla]